MGRWVAVGGLGLVALAFFLALAFPLGPLPALGPMFNPVTGIFAGISGAPPDALDVQGLQAAVTINEDQFAVPHIYARNQHDLFFAEGYLTARERMVQLDLMRRQGRGRLSEILGASALPLDRRELTLGLERTAELSATRLRQQEPETYAVLEAYAAGINAAFAQARETGTLPAFFRLLGYEPAPWAPADTLVVQGLMAEDLAFDTLPLDRAILGAALGEQRAAALYPTYGVNPQIPYDRGPYPQETPVDRARLESVTPAFGPGAGVGGVVISGQTAATRLPAADGAGVTATSNFGRRLAQTLVKQGGVLGGTLTEAMASNNWTVGGQLTDTGAPYLAGDPHLGLTLPAIWFEVHLVAPGFNVYGVSIPGTPGVIIGHNADVAWSLTNTANQQSFYYLERTSAEHADAYSHAGAWRPFSHYRVEIPVAGGPAESFDVPWTVHGAVVQKGLAGFPDLEAAIAAATSSAEGGSGSGGAVISLAWTGNLVADDVRALLDLMQAKDATDVNKALASWGSPVQNFAYATARGEIGIISAGYYPVVEGAVNRSDLLAVTEGRRPWLLLDGAGESDWAGLIPYERLPQAENPADSFLFSANQRPVEPSYPYYIGTAMHFDTGYRAASVAEFLSDPANRPLDAQRLAELQANRVDDLARRMVPVLTALVGRQEHLDASMQQAVAVLRDWNAVMDEEQAAPALWWYFLKHYVQVVFGPWWQEAGLEAGDYSLAHFEPGQWGWKGPLIETLEVLTTSPEDSAAFRRAAYPKGSSQSWFYDPVRHTERSRDEVMLQALGEAVDELSRLQGEKPDRWRWGALHERSIASLLQSPALGRRFPTGGDAFTADVAGNEPSTSGASWRMIANLGDLGSSLGVFPGGESGEPASAHYDDQLALWRRHEYKTLHFNAQPAEQAGGWVTRVWRLQPR